MHRNKILVIDDNESICNLIKKFGELSFGYSIDVAYTIDQAIECIKTKQYQLITLDIELEEDSGLERIRDIKKYFAGPIIFVSCIDDIKSVVEGLQKGADDYVTKPFDLNELFLRITRSLERSGAQQTIQVENYAIDELHNKVYLDGEELDISDNATQILILLLKSKNETLTREKIYNSIWNKDYSFSTRVIDTHISNIRKATNDVRIRSVRAKGYIFEVVDKDE